MKKLLFILLSVCIISCSPVAVHDLPEVEIKPDSSNLTIDITSETTLKARFETVPYVKEYAIQIDDEPINTELTPIGEDGKYAYFKIWNPPAKGTITVFGRSSDSGENDGWVSLAEKSYEIVFKNILPNAYISKRTETSVVINIISSQPLSEIDYQIEMNGEIITAYEKTDSSIIINNLKASEKYDVKIRQKLVTDDSGYNSEIYTSLSVEAFDTSVKNELTLSVDENGFTVTEIPAGVATINLYKRTNSNISSQGTLLLQDIAVEGNGTASIPFDRLNMLEEGYFYVTANGGYASNTTYAITPFRVVSKTENYKSVILEFDFADDIINILNDTSFTVEGVSLTDAISVEKNKITISGLDSNTDYSNKIKLRYTGSTALEPITLTDIKTKSFAGTYSWEGNLTHGGKPNPTNFQIVVKETSEIEGYEGDFPYYVYFADGDESIIEQNKVGEEIRIMPLIDTSNGEKSPTLPNGVNCINPGSDWEKQNYAYLTNAKKWNALEDTDTKSWYIANMNRTHDTFITVAWAGAMIFSKPSEQLATTTTFDFLEADTDGDGVVEPFVKFQNVGSFMVQMGLYSNGTTRNDIEPKLNLTAADLKAIWYLSKIN